MSSSWEHDEPSWRDLRELSSIAFARARQHWPITLLITALATLAVVVWSAEHPRVFPASIVVRVVERNFDKDTAPPRRAELEQLIYDVYLSRSTLISVIERHRLYPNSDISLALEAMHDDLEVHVVQNYFAPEHHIENPVRSARIVISYAGIHPDKSLAVVRELGERIASEESRLRLESSEHAAAAAKELERAWSARLREAHARLAALDLVRDEAPLYGVEATGAGLEIAGLEAELARMSAKSARFALRTRFEAEQSGMHIDLVDSGGRPHVVLTDRQHRILLGILAFVLLLPVVGLSVGTLDTRVGDARVLRRLRIPLLGRIPLRHGRLA